MAPFNISYPPLLPVRLDDSISFTPRPTLALAPPIATVGI